MAGIYGKSHALFFGTWEKKAGRNSWFLCLKKKKKSKYTLGTNI